MSDDESMQTSLSLTQFYRRAKALYEEDQAAFVRFVLSGFDNGERFYVDAIRHALPEDEPIQLTRDYDSLLAISDEIEVENYITVYPVARKEDTLTANVHLKHRFTFFEVRCSFFSYTSSDETSFPRAASQRASTRFRMYVSGSGVLTTTSYASSFPAFTTPITHLR
jgi:hypothetical protein